jgi:hypothetical protein
MATLRINDLSSSLDLDRKAMSSIRGGDGARWVYGWMAAFSPIASRTEAAVNLIQTNNFFTVEQMTNQFLNIAVSNSAANSNIQVTPTVVGITQKQ